MALLQNLSDDGVRSIVSHLAHLRASYGQVLDGADLVEPNSEFFPDAFALEPESIERLLGRMRTYAPLSEDLTIALGFVEDDNASGGGGCGSGACGPSGGDKVVVRGGAVETDEGYGVLVHVGDTGDSSLLTSSIARSLGRIVLFEAGEAVDPRGEAALSELTAVACGLGVLLLKGACVYKKGCGGMKRHRGTELEIEELALAVALFVRVAEKKPASVRKHLEVTQREAFDDALRFVDEQPKLVATLRNAPETLEDGVFDFEEPKGFFSRLFAKKSNDELESFTPVSKRSRTPEEERRLAEARALVDEALQEP